MESIDAIVVGAGVVGLAIAKYLAETGREVLILERAGAIGEEISSRNSEVIHAGIYYPTHSMKARLCVLGRRLLYRYGAERSVAMRRVGKLIVATKEEDRARLRELQEKSLRNGLLEKGEALELLPGSQVLEMETQLHCVEALWSPSTGIVDSHALMVALLGDAETAGASIVFQTEVKRFEAVANGFQVHTIDDSGMEYSLHCRELINSGGLHAQELARNSLEPESADIPQEYWVKGSYFTLSGVKSPFSTLVYPIPSSLGLGVHATIDLAGQTRFGPDTEPVSTIDYSVDPGSAEGFYAAVREYWPQLPPGCLQPGYSGIRPKIRTASGDFVISGPKDHGRAGLVQLFGIESPGLTSCLAIAEEVIRLLEPHKKGRESHV